MRRRGDSLDRRLHAAAHAQEQNHVNRRLLIEEITNLQLISAFARDEIPGTEVFDGAVFPVHYLRSDPYQGNITSEGNGRIFRIRIFGRRSGGEQGYGCKRKY